MIVAHSTMRLLPANHNKIDHKKGYCILVWKNTVQHKLSAIIYNSMLKITPQGIFRSIKEFMIFDGGEIGCGSFGTVKLALHKLTNKIYAIKIVDLTKMSSEDDLRLIKREIDIHSQLDHPHIVKLWDTFTDTAHIYLIMEYAEGGNLFYYQNAHTIFSETDAYMFFIQVAQAIHYMHSKDIIHRDIKPQNILLDQHNNIKLCDMGWCAFEKDKKRTTFCGTYQYMAPQMIFGSEYDCKVDSWALGVLLYELLHGSAPFKGKSIEAVQAQMIKGCYKLNQNLSRHLKQLITSLLQQKPVERLTIQQIIEHCWVQEMSSAINQYAKESKITKPNVLRNSLSNLSAYLERQEKNVSHHKNNSTAVQSININLSITNFKEASSQKPVFHSQGKDLNNQIKKAFRFKRKKSAEERCKTQADEDALKTPKAKQDFQNPYTTVLKQGSHKQAPRELKNQKFKKCKKKSNDLQGKNLKVRKSQDQLGPELMNFRFNTETNQKDQLCNSELSKIRKIQAKNKMMNSGKNLCRIMKNKMEKK